MKALLIDVQRNVVEYVEPRGLIDFYRLINCDLIDITCREINGKRYDIICDDYGLVRDKVKFSAVTAYGSPVLAGNLIYHRRGRRKRRSNGFAAAGYKALAG